jgi:hypothetical protein
MYKNMQKHLISVVQKDDVSKALVISLTVYLSALILNMFFLFLNEPWSNHLVQRLELLAILLIIFSWIIFVKKIIDLKFFLALVTLPFLHIIVFSILLIY